MRKPYNHVTEFSPIEQRVFNSQSTRTRTHIGRYEEDVAALPVQQIYAGIWAERNRINELQFTQLSGISSFIIRIMWLDYGLGVVERVTKQLRSHGVDVQLGAKGSKE